MKKISLIIALLLGNVGSLAYTSSMYNPFNDYVPELGMPLSQVTVYGGPQIQYLMKRFSSVNWNGNLRTQRVPIIARDEIAAFNREFEIIKQLRRKYSSMGHYRVCNVLDRLITYLYTTWDARMKSFPVVRPDAVR